MAKSVEQEAATRDLPVLNATCPLVTKVHNQGKRYVGQGRKLILIGHAGHPEVEGTMGQIPAPVTLVQNEKRSRRARHLPADTPVAYVTQTTLSVDDTQGIIAGAAAQVHRHRRPGDARHLLRDAEPPVGGARPVQARRRHPGGRRARISSNSNRLREIGAEEGIPSYLIADGSELQPEWLEGAEVVGITAGASAPEVLVEDVIDALRRLGPVEVSTLPGREENIEFRLPAELAERRHANGQPGELTAGRLRRAD